MYIHKARGRERDDTQTCHSRSCQLKSSPTKLTQNKFKSFHVKLNQSESEQAIQINTHQLYAITEAVTTAHICLKRVTI
jgi:hypothetical protein